MSNTQNDSKSAESAGKNIVDHTLLTDFSDEKFWFKQSLLLAKDILGIAD